MEGMIARWYAKNTRQGREFDALAKRVSKIVPAGGRILEVAPGPGFLSVEIAKTGKYQVSGVEISKTFVEIEQVNAKAAGVEIDFRQGDAANMNPSQIEKIYRSLLDACEWEVACFGRNEANDEGRAIIQV